MPYRTKTYIAAEWEGDSDLVEQLRKWNESNFWSLHFLDAHELGEARDGSLNCSIKRSLADRLAHSKTFVLIVGQNTLTARSGSCRYCSDYSSYSSRCLRGDGHTVDNRSYIEYECDYAVHNDLNIVVLYNYASVHREKCPESVRYSGNHVASYYQGDDGKYYWDYAAVKSALDC